MTAELALRLLACALVALGSGYGFAAATLGVRRLRNHLLFAWRKQPGVRDCVFPAAIAGPTAALGAAAAASGALAGVRGWPPLLGLAAGPSALFFAIATAAAAHQLVTWRSPP